MPNFEKFTRTMTSLTRAPQVTIQRRGALSLNLAAFTALDRPDSVELLFDPAIRLLGLRPAASNDPGGHHLRPTTRSGSGPWVVSAAAFARFYDIDTSSAARWDAYLDGSVLCVDVSRPGTPVTSNRARTGK